MTPEEAEERFGPLLADPNEPQPWEEFIAEAKVALERWVVKWKKLN